MTLAIASGTLTPVAEETPEQAEARRRLRRHAAARKRSAEQEAALIREAAEVGVKQVDIARDIDRSREHIRITVSPEKRK